MKRIAHQKARRGGNHLIAVGGQLVDPSYVVAARADSYNGLFYLRLSLCDSRGQALNEVSCKFDTEESRDAARQQIANRSKQETVQQLTALKADAWEQTCRAAWRERDKFREELTGCQAVWEKAKEDLRLLQAVPAAAGNVPLTAQDIETLAARCAENLGSAAGCITHRRIVAVLQRYLGESAETSNNNKELLRTEALQLLGLGSSVADQAVQALVNALSLIEHATAPGKDGAYHENAYGIAQAALTQWRMRAAGDCFTAQHVEEIILSRTTLPLLRLHSLAAAIVWLPQQVRDASVTVPRVKQLLLAYDLPDGLAEELAGDIVELYNGARASKSSVSAEVLSPAWLWDFCGAKQAWEHNDRDQCEFAAFAQEYIDAHPALLLVVDVKQLADDIVRACTPIHPEFRKAAMIGVLKQHAIETQRVPVDTLVASIMPPGCLLASMNRAAWVKTLSAHVGATLVSSRPPAMPLPQSGETTQPSGE